MKSLRLSAPAKINLFLKVLGRRQDGYHELQTVFHFLDFCDVLQFDIGHEPDIHFSSNDPGLAGDDNLVLRAAKLMADIRQQRNPAASAGVSIHLEKCLPVGGGIGGGSSDAATCLLALNQLWQTGLEVDALAELGLDLGADVPVFVRGQSAVGEGRGERLEALDIPEFYYLLAVPDCEVSTARIFGHRELTRDSSPRTIRAFPEGVPAKIGKKSFRTKAFQHLVELVNFGNDCQNLVRKLYPEIDQTIAALEKFAPTQLTGTGACVFAVFETREEAADAQERLRGQKLIKQLKIVKGLNHSPVHEQLRKA